MVPSLSYKKKTTGGVRTPGPSRRQAARLAAALRSDPFLPAAPGTPPSRSSAAAAAGGGGGGVGSRQSYAAVASGRASEMATRDVQPYLKMLLDPMDRTNGCRYPDETIVPTALTHLASSQTVAIANAGSTTPNTVFTALRWKVCADDPATPWNTNPIWAPSTLSGAGASIVDYGAPQASWLALDSIDRTLALGIRTRLVGLPTSTFLPSGTLYFFQIQNTEWNAVVSTLQTVGESVAISLVTAGKGFSMTVNELSKLDAGVVLSYLPQGPMSFVFSDKNSEAAALAGAGVTSTLPSGVVSANSGIMVVGFGIQEDVVLRFDYAHHVEYVPSISAAGLVATKVEPPSAASRQAISKAAMYVQDVRAGATSAAEVKPIVSGASSIVGSLARFAVGLIPGASSVLAGASAAASALGAPAWLKTGLSMLT